MLTGKQKSYLRSLAQTSKPIMQVGKNGITENFIENFNDALDSHELVKVSILQNCLEDKADLVEILCNKTKCESVQVIGNQLIFYRHSNKENIVNPIILP